MLRLFSHPGTTLPPHPQVKPMLDHLRTLAGPHVAAQGLDAGAMRAEAAQTTPTNGAAAANQMDVA